MEAFLFISKILVGAIFLMASLTKLPRIIAFAGEMQQYRLLPPPATAILARVLPFVELALAIALLSGTQVRAASVVALALLAVFLVAAISAIVRRLSVGCACFGVLFRMPISRYTIARDSVLIILVAIIIVGGHPGPTVFEAASNVSDPWNLAALVVTAVGTLSCLWVVYLANRPRALQVGAVLRAEEVIGSS